MSVNLSVIIITRNEQENIKRCLESVQWADEIIVFDSGSTDRTIDICRQYTDKIWQTDWPGYGKQKQRALAKASGHWVLSIDADEELSEGLKQEIRQVMQSKDGASGYQVRISLVFYRKMIRYANGNNACLRLVRRSLAKFTDQAVHESLCVSSGRIKKLKKPMYHYSAPSVSSIIYKMNKYTDISASRRAEHEGRAGVGRGFLAALWMFFRVYFLQRGFLDGRMGFVLAVGFAEGAFYRYVKTYFLRLEKSNMTEK